MKRFYRAHYRPDGAVLVVVGDVEPEAALDRIARHFASVPAGAVPLPSPAIVEPRQTGRRDFAVSEPDSAARACSAGARCHGIILTRLPWTFWPICFVAAAAGGFGNLWSRPTRRPRGSKQRTAPRSAPASSSSSSKRPRPRTERPSSEGSPRSCSGWADDGPSSDELARSRRRLEAAWRWEQEDLSSLAGGLGTTALWGDWRRWQGEHRAAVAVEAGEIRRVLQTYLVDSGLTVGWSSPQPRGRGALAATNHVDAFLNDNSPAASLPRRSPAAAMTSARDVAAAPADSPTTSIPLALPSGICRTCRLPAATFRIGQRSATDLSSDGRALGSSRSSCSSMRECLREAKPGLACLTGRMLEEGTATRTAQELAQAIEDVGGSLEVGSTGCSLRVCCEDLPLAIELLGDVTLRPAFPAEAVSWVARRIAAELRGDLEDPAFRTELSFRGLIYGAHPLARDPRGVGREIARLTRQRRDRPPSPSLHARRTRFWSRSATSTPAAWSVRSRRSFGGLGPTRPTTSAAAAGSRAGATARPTHPPPGRAGSYHARSPEASLGTIPTTTPWPFSTTSSAADPGSATDSAGSCATSWAWSTPSAAG